MTFCRFEQIGSSSDTRLILTEHSGRIGYGHLERKATMESRMSAMILAFLGLVTTPRRQLLNLQQQETDMRGPAPRLRMVNPTVGYGRAWYFRT
jgi:hypothetical protein